MYVNDCAPRPCDAGLHWKYLIKAYGTSKYLAGSCYENILVKNMYIYSRPVIGCGNIYVIFPKEKRLRRMTDSNL